MKLFTIIFTVLLITTNSIKIKPTITKLPKITYIKSDLISRRKSGYIPRKRPYAFLFIKQINKPLSYLINNIINNYIDKKYVMGILPLSFIILNDNNLTNNNITNDNLT